MSAKRQLKETIVQLAQEAVKKRGRRFDWLSFAKRPALRDAFYKMAKQCDCPWDIMEEIVGKASGMFPEFAYSEVVDTASEIFNTDESELSFI